MASQAMDPGSNPGACIYVDRMKIVIFVRHAESVTNATGILSSGTDGYPLTEVGRKQANSIGSVLSQIKVDKIFSSPIQRARETAEIISKHLPATSNEIKLDGRLAERGFGPIENKHKPEDPDFELHEAELGIETWESLKERMGSFMQNLPPGVSLAVSHFSPISASASVILKLDQRSGLTLGPTNARFTAIDVEGNRVLAINADNISRLLKARTEK